MFKNADAALRWAFRVMATEIVKLSSINRMSGSSGSADLSPHDKHAQAALIMQVLERELNQLEIAYVMAHYRGIGRLEHESEVVAMLSKAVIAAFPTGMHSMRGASKLVRIYFGQDIGISSIRRDFKCGNDKSNEYRDIAFKQLSGIGGRADAVIEDALIRSGIVESQIAKFA